jgi:hypothetical protein
MIPNLKDRPELTELIRRSREIVDAMTPEEREAMCRRQAEGWARSEVQWAKDFREGKCERD